MRFLIATLIAFALALLPVGGTAMAKPMAMQTTSGAAHHGACHDMPAGDEKPGDMGSACAEHCMMQVSAPLAPDAVAQPSIANAIGAERALLIDSRAPRAADPPETPPPRG